MHFPAGQYLPSDTDPRCSPRSPRTKAEILLGPYSEKCALSDQSSYLPYFFNVHPMCCLNDNFLSNRTPRSFSTSSSCLIQLVYHQFPSSYILILSSSCHKSYLCVHFDALQLSCHLSDQSHSEYASFCNVSMSSSVCTSLYAFVSSERAHHEQHLKRATKKNSVCFRLSLSGIEGVRPCPIHRRTVAVTQTVTTNITSGSSSWVE